MISTLHIKNIGIIDDLIIDFNEGFNVLTGETGAGKSLIVESLAIICGGRFSKDMIRNGEEYSFVEACLYCPDNQLAIDGNIIVSREIYLNGRNSCKINGRLVTVNELKKIMSKIIDIHGQQDNQNLLDSSKHIKYLDDFIGISAKQIKEKYIELFYKYTNINDQLNKNYGDDKERQRKLDLLQYQLSEIEKANLKLGEEEELQSRHLMMKNHEKLVQNIKLIDESLSIQVIDGINSSIKCLEKIEDCGEVYSQKLSELKNIYYDVQELSRDISGMQESTYFDEYERDNVERRLDVIFDLKRKYGNSIEEIIQYKKQLEDEISCIENLDTINQKLKVQKKELENEMHKYCEQLTKIRVNFAIELSNRINKELKDLEMRNAKINIKVDKINEFNRDGLDKVEFMICTNLGDEEKQLLKIASGGEMARVMLAIKSVLSDIDEVATLIFDEIDTGISGKAAKSVAEKLIRISKSHQVLCITHLASIAAKGDYNYYISKKVKKDKTFTSIKKLNEEETIKEIARIANGEITDIAIKNARELRKVG